MIHKSGMIDGAPRTWDELEQDKLINKFIDVSLLDSYYSLARKDTYDTLYRLISRNEVKDFLQKIRDIAYNQQYIERIKYSGVFGSSLIRGITIMTLKNSLYNAAYDYQQNKYFLKLIYEVDDKNFSLKMESDSNSLLPTNLHTLIGDNGVGKSRLLRDFAVSVVDKGQYKIKSEYLSESRNFKLENGEDLSNVVYINLNPFDNISSEFKGYFDNNRLPSSYVGSLKNIKILFENSAEEAIQDVFDKPFDDLIKTKEKRKYISQICEQFKWDEVIFKVFRNIDNITIAKDTIETEDYLRKKKDDILKIVQSSSSGQKYLIILILSVIENIIAQSVLIIDEPEDFLHPPYVAALVSFISRILKEVNGFGLIATHSDIALQEIPRTCVHHLLQNNQVETPKIQTYAANVALINREIFGVSLRNTGFYVYLENLVAKNPKRAKFLLAQNLLGESGSFYLSLLLKRSKN